jgi:long-chain acyl-CoA synthetase
MNVASLALDELERHGTYEKLHFEGREYTNAELLGMAERLSGALADLGVTRGDRVVVMVPNCPEVPVSFGATLRLGAVVVPVLFLLTEVEIEHILRDSQAKVAITSPEFLPKLLDAASRLETPPRIACIGQPYAEAPGVLNLTEMIEHGSAAPMVEMQSGDLAVLSYTSGTTGTPKGVMLSHGNALFNARASAAATDLRDGDRSIQCLPLAHSFGIGAMLTGQLVKATGYLLRWFTADAFFEAVEKHRATSSACVPTMLSFLLTDPRFDDIDWSSMRWIVSGGAALPMDVATEFEHRSGVRVLQGYGLTETSPTISVMRVDDPPKPGSCGRPVEGCEVRVVDDEGSTLPPGETGEVQCRGANVMLGYKDAPQATQAVLSDDGWFSTGDLGHLDEDGFLYITDRKKDLIIRGGFNIIPRDVEEVLHSHPLVAQAAVVGGAHPTLGEEVIAFVVPAPGATVTEADLIAFSQQSLAKYKTPRRIVMREALPMNGIGKILRRELREEASKLATEG